MVLLAFIAIFISQILIILAWKEANYGTTINILILLVGISVYANYRFKKLVAIESAEIFFNVNHTNSKFISERELNHVPNIIKKWLQNSKVIGDKEILTVRIKQKGEMRKKPNSKLMPFVATQYFNLQNPSFIWNTNVEAMPFLKFAGRDKLIDGYGEMLIKVAE